MSTIGERIRIARKKKGLSQEKLGQMVGLQKAAISKYEKDVVTDLKRSMISDLAKALDVSPSYLNGWNDEENYSRTHIKYEEDEEVVGDLTYLLNEFHDHHDIQLLKLSINAIYKSLVDGTS